MTDQIPTPKPEDPETILRLTPAKKKALEEIIADRLWWDEAIKRATRMGAIIVAGAAALAFLSAWLPWITSLAQALLKDVPR